MTGILAAILNRLLFIGWLDGCLSWPENIGLHVEVKPSRYRTFSRTSLKPSRAWRYGNLRYNVVEFTLASAVLGPWHLIVIAIYVKFARIRWYFTNMESV